MVLFLIVVKKDFWAEIRMEKIKYIDALVCQEGVCIQISMNICNNNICFNPDVIF